MNTTYKQVIIIRNELKLPKGKLAAQVAHASVDATLKADKTIVKAWRQEGMAKIITKVETLADLYRYAQSSKDAEIATAIISDAGKTVVAPGTVTCVAIGPDEAQKVDDITAELKLL